MRTNLVLGTSMLSVVLVVAMPASARAQGFVSPFIGFAGGDASCATESDCEGRTVAGGVSFGALGSVAGFEAEVGYVPTFLGDVPGVEATMLTLMGNLMIAPRFGPVRPYGIIGVGLMRSDASLTLASLLVSENNNFGWDAGGGLMIFFGSHVGIRGDVRRFESLQDVNLLGFTLPDTKITFGRVSGALIFVF